MGFVLGWGGDFEQFNSMLIRPLVRVNFGKTSTYPRGFLLLKGGKKKKKKFRGFRGLNFVGLNFEGVAVSYSCLNDE